VYVAYFIFKKRWKIKKTLKRKNVSRILKKCKNNVLYIYAMHNNDWLAWCRMRQERKHVNAVTSG